MSLPPGIPTFTLVAEFPPLSPDGAVRQGSLRCIPIPGILPSPDAVYLGEENATVDASGGLSKTLIANDAFTDPFAWRLDGDIDGVLFSTTVSIPASAGTVNLGAIAEFEVLPPDYVVVVGPQGPAGDTGGGGGGTPSGTVTASTSFGQSSAAGSATTYSRGDHAHGTPTAPTKASLGLGSVDNTSDASKPLSTATTGAFATEVARANAAYDAAGAAGTVATNLSTHTGSSTSVHGITDTAALVVTADSRLTNSRAPSGAAGGDLSGTFPNPSVEKVAGVAVSGTAASGKVLTASSSSAAAWQDPAGGGGGGVSIRTASVRITDDNLAGLPSASGWTVAVTSASTPLQAAIAASAGDRIRVCGNFMRAGSHFLDWVLLDSAGAIALYASTGTGTAPGEGNPTMYPSLSFSYATSDEMFTVASGHISSGLVTVALAHQGTGSGLVYAHSTYPWRLRLENIGPEPA